MNTFDKLSVKNMITVPEATKKIVMRSRYLSEAMSKGIINNSSLARYIKPEVEEMLIKKVSNSSVIMALNRMSAEIKPKYFTGNIFKMPPQIVVHSNIESADGNSLSSITISVPKEAVKTPGVLYFFIKSLAWERISIASVNTSFKEIELIFYKKDINRAFGIIQSLFTKTT
ncbi:MAG: hypothetical protein WD967_01300 [Candidatus Levyibacteriota bacterium]